MSVKQKTSNKTVTRSEVRWKTALIGVLVLLCAVVVFPSHVNRGIDWINSGVNLGLPRLSEKSFNLGLDLQGGAHLIYQAKTDQIPAADRASSVEGVRDVIEQRVRGGLGVAEPLVQTTRVGEEFRIIVELPGVTDVSQAIKLIGETPVLEFKEQNTDAPRELTAEEQKQLSEYNAAATKKASEALAVVRRGMPFDEAVSKYSDDAPTKNNGGDMGYITNELYPDFYAWAAKSKDGAVSQVIKTDDGLNIVKRIGQQDGAKQVSASHLLLCYKGTNLCDNPQYSKEEAKNKIEEIKREATLENFNDLVRQYSTEPGAADRAGDLGFFKKGDMVPEFESAVWDAPVNTIIGPVETDFGYHLVVKKAEKTEPEYKLARIFVNTKDKSDFLPLQGEWKNTDLGGKQLERAEVTEDTRTGQIQVSLKFDEEGTKLFAEITERNVGKPLAIFLDGSPITDSPPTVSEPILNGSAVITGGYTYNEARLMAQRLNSGALPVPVEVIGQEKVDATLGVESLQKSLYAGLVGLALVMIFMLLYYRLPGALSVVSLVVYAVLGLAIFKLVGVTLTLSGIAAFILSIGMAVDTNVLVFERLKEELKGGRILNSAVEESFVRSWPSIRDGHVTTLISCVILLWFGVGFIQGFATVLAIGTIISLFTAITVTRTIMRLVVAWFKNGANQLFLGYTKK